MIRTHGWRILVAGALTTLLAGCTERAPTPASSEAPSGPIEVGSLPEGWERCTNEVQGWSIGYPGTWFTTDRFTDSLTGRETVHPDVRCEFFEPEPFQIIGDGEFPYTALEAHLDRQRFETVLGYLTDHRYWRILSREGVEVLGWPAVRLEGENTGRGLLPGGTRTYVYLIDLGGGRSFEVRTTQIPAPGPTDYEAHKVVVDRAVSTLQIGGAPSPP